MCKNYIKLHNNIEKIYNMSQKIPKSKVVPRPKVYTGLKDINGERIYRNDIVEMHGDYYIASCVVIKKSKKRYNFMVDIVTGRVEKLSSLDLVRKVGDAFNNPEYLEI